ncbi:hypothetical protein B0I37DRAFT_378903 [Chaetomium sp. MPI-CAGE-AT-0009]|nr:hypothetical protein B0I37DRAFT_378903 [Chaetomium sp. MPI-CAGE-AT-0009]
MYLFVWVANLLFEGAASSARHRDIRVSSMDGSCKALANRTVQRRAGITWPLKCFCLLNGALLRYGWFRDLPPQPWTFFMRQPDLAFLWLFPVGFFFEESTSTSVCRIRQHVGRTGHCVIAFGVCFKSKLDQQQANSCHNFASKTSHEDGRRRKKDKGKRLEEISAAATTRNQK